jgi:hypothetical protein
MHIGPEFIEDSSAILNQTTHQHWERQPSPSNGDILIQSITGIAITKARVLRS